MKYSNYIGIVAAVLLIISCFIPWAYISSIDTTITGVDSGRTNLGKPGAMNMILSIAAILLFNISTIVAKRANIFIGAFNLAWAFRNFLLVTQCEMGECPDKRFGIYAILALSVIMLLMTLFPKVALKNDNKL